MLKHLLFIFIMIFLVACGSAPGSEGGDCLEGNICEHDYLVCGAEGKCVICGFEEDPCCADGTCRENHVCGSDGFCGPCGWDGVACCESRTCQEGHACGEDGMCHGCGYSGTICCPDGSCNNGHICSPDNECVSCGFHDEPCCEGGMCDEGYICGENNMCEGCGYADEPCCPDDTCHEGYVCTPSGLCDYCGELGQLSCEGPVCKGWYLPHEGICQNPFEVDKGTTLSICEQAEPGEVERFHRDWCYWYGAYWKMDTTICVNIEWEQMRTVCERGQNPDDFDITWIVK